MRDLSKLDYDALLKVGNTSLQFQIDELKVFYSTEEALRTFIAQALEERALKDTKTEDLIGWDKKPAVDLDAASAEELGLNESHKKSKLLKPKKAGSAKQVPIAAAGNAMREALNKLTQLFDGKAEKETQDIEGGQE